MEKKKIVLALGGGGLKGYAHIGVISALEDLGYEIVGIAGTSAGGVFGSFYAYGYSIVEILSFIHDIDKTKLFQRMPSDGPSLIGLKGLYQILDDKFGDRELDQLKIPFATTAVDINTNREIFINCGKLSDAVKATSAMPGVFPYIKIYDLTLVDGGVYDPVPVNLARWLISDYPIIAVSLAPEKEKAQVLSNLQIPNISPIPSSVVQYFANMRLGKALDTFLISLDVMQMIMTDMQIQLTQPDICLFPDTSKYYYIDDVNPEELIENGRRSVEVAQGSINDAIENFHPKPVRKTGLLLSEWLSDNDQRSVK